MTNHYLIKKITILDWTLVFVSCDLNPTNLNFLIWKTTTALYYLKFYVLFKKNYAKLECLFFIEIFIIAATVSILFFS